jgi:hypothetical protein
VGRATNTAERWRLLTYCLIAFHDKTFECIADARTVAGVNDSFRAILDATVGDLVDRCSQA